MASLTRRKQCNASTRAGCRCSITCESKLLGRDGIEVALPLKIGFDNCLMHSQIFSTMPAAPVGKQILMFAIDLETTGTNIYKDRIVELSAVQIWPMHVGVCFSSTIKIDQEMLLSPSAKAAARVHGILDEDILASPDFKECWLRFLQFVEATSNSQVAEQLSDESSDDECCSSHLQYPSEPPQIIFAAHNGICFDFPLLLCEIIRHSLSTSIFESWKFVDTLIIAKQMQYVLNEPHCLKLQCVVESLAKPSALAAHRARDDCVALGLVLQYFAERLDVSLNLLIEKFALQVSLQESVAIACMLLQNP